MTEVVEDNIYECPTFRGGGIRIGELETDLSFEIVNIKSWYLGVWPILQFIRNPQNNTKDIDEMLMHEYLLQLNGKRFQNRTIVDDRETKIIDMNIVVNNLFPEDGTKILNKNSDVFESTNTFKLNDVVLSKDDLLKGFSSGYDNCNFVKYKDAYIAMAQNKNY